MGIEAYRIQNSNGTTNVHLCFPVVKAQSVRIKMQSIWVFACSPEAMVLLMLILLKSIAHVQIACSSAQLLIFPKPKYYCNVTYPSQKSQAEVYQRPKNTPCQVFTPFLTKKCPKEPLGITILTVFFSQPAVASMLRRLLSVCHVGSSKNKSSSWQNECWGVCLANSEKNEKQKKTTLCRRVMRDRLWFYSDTVQALEKGLRIVS